MWWNLINIIGVDSTHTVPIPLVRESTVCSFCTFISKVLYVCEKMVPPCCVRLATWITVIFVKLKILAGEYSLNIYPKFCLVRQLIVGHLSFKAATGTWFCGHEIFMIVGCQYFPSICHFLVLKSDKPFSIRAGALWNGRLY